MINGQITGQGEVIARLALVGERLQKPLSEALARISQELMADYVKPLVKFSSGRLASSLEAGVEEGGGRLSAVVSASAPYAAFVEYGFQGIENVAGHMRAQRVAWGRAMASPHEVWVRPYARHVDVPGTSYLRAGLSGYAASGLAETNIAGAVEEAIA